MELPTEGGPSKARQPASEKAVSWVRTNLVSESSTSGTPRRPPSEDGKKSHAAKICMGRLSFRMGKDPEPGSVESRTLKLKTSLASCPSQPRHRSGLQAILRPPALLARRVNPVRGETRVQATAAALLLQSNGSNQLALSNQHLLA